MAIMEENDDIIELVFETEKEYTIYLLPNENYVGISTNLKNRLYTHRSLSNRNVEGVEVIMTTMSLKREAYYYEMRIQTELGYKGCTH